MKNSLGERSLKEFRVNACDAITFKLISTKGDFDGGVEFHPEYAHQLFGDNEQIFGYLNLKVNIWYLAGSLSTYIGISYSATVDPTLSKNVPPDDIYQLLSENYPYSFDRNLVDFSQTFHNDSFSPIGAVRHTYHITSEQKCSPKYCVYFMEYGMDHFQEFLEYHKRMESFLLFFVDGASAIPTDDTQWCYYTLFEVNDSSSGRPSSVYSFVGYMTVYKFYAYPANLRPRLSQILILPPFRNKGHASELLQTFYRDFIHVPNVQDITVEDPSDDFRRIRDFIDCKRCLEQPDIMDSLKGKLENTQLNGSTDGSTHKAHYLNFRNKAQRLLKISRCQSRRIYEILQLYLLPRTSEAVAVFERALHKRTVASYERARTDAMCGRAVDRRRDAPGPGEAVSMVFGELADECYKSQVAGYVAAELEAYQAVVRKLDRLLHSPSTVKNDHVTCDT